MFRKLSDEEGHGTVPPLLYSKRAYRQARDAAVASMVSDLELPVAVDPTLPSSQAPVGEGKQIHCLEDNGPKLSCAPGLFTEYTKKLASMECCICLAPLHDTSITQDYLEARAAHVCANMDRKAAFHRGAVTAAGEKRPRDDGGALLDVFDDLIRQHKDWITFVHNGLGKTQHVGIAGCGHMFHYSCIRKHLASRSGCPLCRQSIDRVGYPKFPKGSQDRLPPTRSVDGVSKDVVVRARHTVNQGSATSGACCTFATACKVSCAAVLEGARDVRAALRRRYDQYKRNAMPSADDDVASQWRRHALSPDTMIAGIPTEMACIRRARNRLRDALCTSFALFLEEVFIMCQHATAVVLSATSMPPLSRDDGVEKCHNVEDILEWLTILEDTASTISQCPSWQMLVRSPKSSFVETSAQSKSPPPRSCQATTTDCGVSQIHSWLTSLDSVGAGDEYEGVQSQLARGDGADQHPSLAAASTYGPEISAFINLLFQIYDGLHIPSSVGYGRRDALNGDAGWNEFLLVYLSDLLPSQRQIHHHVQEGDGGRSSEATPLQALKAYLAPVTHREYLASTYLDAARNEALIREVLPRPTLQLWRSLFLPGSLHRGFNVENAPVSVLEVTGSVPPLPVRSQSFFIFDAAEAGFPGAPYKEINPKSTVVFQAALPSLHWLSFDFLSAQYPVLLAVEGHARFPRWCLSSLVRSIETEPMIAAPSAASSSPPNPLAPQASISGSNTIDATDANEPLRGLSFTPLSLCSEYLSSIAASAQARHAEAKEVEKRRENLERRCGIAKREVAELEAWLRYARLKEDMKKSIGYVGAQRSGAASNHAGDAGSVDMSTPSTPTATATAAPLSQNGTPRQHPQQQQPPRKARPIVHDWTKNPFSAASLQQAQQRGPRPLVGGPNGDGDGGLSDDKTGVFRDTYADIRRELAEVEGTYKKLKQADRHNRLRLRELTAILREYEVQGAKVAPALDALTQETTPPSTARCGSPSGGVALDDASDSTTDDEIAMKQKASSQRSGGPASEDADDLGDLFGATSTDPRSLAPSTTSPPQQQQQTSDRAAQSQPPHCRLERYESPARDGREGSSTEDEDDEADL